MLCLGSPAVLQITGSQAAARQQEASRGQGSQLSTSRTALLIGHREHYKCYPPIYISIIYGGRLSIIQQYVEKGGHYSVDNGVSILCSVLLCRVCIRCQLSVTENMEGGPLALCSAEIED